MLALVAMRPLMNTVVAVVLTGQQGRIYISLMTPKKRIGYNDIHHPARSGRIAADQLAGHQHMTRARVCCAYPYMEMPSIRRSSPAMASPRQLSSTTPTISNAQPLTLFAL